MGKKRKKKAASKSKPIKANAVNLGFEDKLWAAADKLQGHMDPGEYKHVVLGVGVRRMRRARQAATVQEQHQVQEQIRDLEKKKRRQRQRIFDVEDEIAEKRDQMIDALEKRMQQRTSSGELFTIRWTVV